MTVKWIRALAAFFLASTSFGGRVHAQCPPCSETEAPSCCGQWAGPYKVISDPDPLDLEIAHAIVVSAGLDQGRVLLVINRGGASTDRVWIFDPNNPWRTEEVGPTGITSDIFCSGHCALPSGQVLFAGGSPPGSPPTASYLYDPPSRTFIQQANMNCPRFYPSCVTLFDHQPPFPLGRIFVDGGQCSSGPACCPGAFPAPGGGILQWEVFDPSTPSNPWSMMHDPGNPVHIDQYPQIFLLSTGRLFQVTDILPFAIPAAGESLLINLSPPQLLSSFSSNAVPAPASDRRYGSFVLIHDPSATPPITDWVVAMGGWCNASAAQCPTAGTDDALDTVQETIGWGTPNPQWVFKSPMNHRRVFSSAVLLPDRTILQVGGTTKNYRHQTQPPPSTIIKVPEIFDPQSPGSPGTWTSMAAHLYERVYHSVPVLLDDGRVAVFGGEAYPYPTPQNEAAMHSVEIFSPPYLFYGSRPAITSVPPSIGYFDPLNPNFSLGVQVPTGQVVQNVALIRPNSATHQVDFEQRYVGLSFSGSPPTLSVQKPAANLAPPGYYRIWVVTSTPSGQRIPSQAAWVRVP